jgi:hypothetical protein
MQPDPLRYAAGDTNLYRYVSNRPATLSDPSGLLDLGPAYKWPSADKACKVCLGQDAKALTPT